MTVAEDVGRLASTAAAFADEGEELVGVLVAETLGRRVYLCAFESAEGRAWLALGDDAEPLTERRLVTEAASLSALCEVAEESAGGGHLPELRAGSSSCMRRRTRKASRKRKLRPRRSRETLQPEPRIASGDYLDAIGSASRRLEQALGETDASPFAAAMQAALGSVEELSGDVERNYKLPLV